MLVNHVLCYWCLSHMFHSQDGHGLGTVTKVDGVGDVWVKWDNGDGPYGYAMGYNGWYHVTLAECISEEEKKIAEEEKEREIREEEGQS